MQNVYIFNILRSTLLVSAANAQAGNPAPGVAANTVLTIFVTGDTRYATAPAGEPMQNAEWANYQARVPLPIVIMNHLEQVFAEFT